MNRAISQFLSALVLAASLVSCGESPPSGFARATVIERLDQAIGGPKALAQPGDFLLENQHLRVAILAGRDINDVERHSAGPGLYGGSLIDADLQWADPSRRAGQGRDQFAELIPTANLDVTRTGAPDSVRIIADGADGGPAIIRAQGPREPFLTLLSALWGIVGAPMHYLTTDYIVEPDKSWVTVRTTVSYGHDGSLDPEATEVMGYHEGGLPLLSWAVESGVVGGDFYLSGGSVDVFAPDFGFDEDGQVYRSMQQGDNTFNVPYEFDFIAGVADGVSYGLASAEGSIYVPLFTASQTVVVAAGRDGDGTRARFELGAGFSFERYFFVGHGDVGSIVDQYVEARGIPYGQVSGHVVSAVGGDGVSGASVLVYRPGAQLPWSQWLTDVHPFDRNPDGSFSGRLPVGTWEIAVHDRARPAQERVTVTVEAGSESTLLLAVPPPGTFSFDIVDETGLMIPAKITLYRTDRSSARNPDLGDGFLAGGAEAVYFAMHGHGEVTLREGNYIAVASRGLEYETASYGPFAITDRGTQHAELTLIRSVQTDGWISADLHVHANPSHDSGVTLADRVRTMACEGVEFFVSTDHDYLTDYAPVIDALGLEQWVQSAVGNEVTTIEVGHFLGFPLVADHLKEAGGAVDWTGQTPDEILAWFRETAASTGADPVLFIGHPRDGILGYFDQYGFDPYAGVPGIQGAPGVAAISQPLLSATNPLLAPGNMSWDFHGLELLNGKRFELIRTPTQRELDRVKNGDPIDVYQLMSRTLEEQDALEQGVYRLGFGIEGHIDDWFTLLNLGYKFTVLGNSDTHGTTGVESGCPRNYVMSSTDSPAFISDQEIADAVKAHRVVASYGPFMQMWLGDAQIGDELVPTGDGPLPLTVEVQAPSWMAVDRVEIYENGTLIHEIDVPVSSSAERLFHTVEVNPTKDSWYVAVALGDGSLEPVFGPVEIPYIELQMIVTESLGGISAVSSLLSPAIPIPREFPVRPYAITNPIWVDRAGDGFDAPGIPGWLRRPVDPN